MRESIVGLVGVVQAEVVVDGLGGEDDGRWSPSGCMPLSVPWPPTQIRP